jgi:recombination protein RecR
MDPEGESTANYIGERLEATGVRVTRIALGLPSGAQVGYSDSATLAGAFSARRPV